MVDVRVWGKERGLVEPYPLIGHLVDTGVVAGALWDGFLAESQQAAIAGELGVRPEEARSMVSFWAGLHDVGKIQPGFQFQRDALRHGSCAALLADGAFAGRVVGDSGATVLGHQVAGARVLPELLAELGYPEGRRRPAGWLVVRVAQLLGGHHGRYPGLPDARNVFNALKDFPELGAGGWEVQRREHVAALREVLGHPEGGPTGAGLSVQAAVVVAGLVVVADWLASQDDFVVRQQAADAADGGLGTMEALRAHAGRAAAEAPGLLRGAELARAQFAVRGFRERFPEIRQPHPLQDSVDAELTQAGVFGGGPGVLLVTAPPGEGKTEVALAAAAAMGQAAGCPGVAFLLPTRATADQLYGRVAAFGRANLLGDAALTLLHGAADLNERYSPDRQSEPELEPRTLTEDDTRTSGASVSAGGWLRTRGRGLLAPLSVGTVDQALLAVLPLRHNALRQLGLAGKTVVVDEAHAYDAFTHALLLRLLVWLGAMRVPVVLLSATLTGRTATGMVEAYLTGAGRKPGSYELPAPSYPGWVYADGATAAVTVPSGPIGTNRPSSLRIDLLPVTHTYDPAAGNGRLAALLRELTPVAEAGGCVAVICTTVGEAQQTFNALREHFRPRFGPDYQGWDDRVADPGEPDGPDGGAGAGLREPRLRLLHARFPGRRRNAITREAEKWFGRVEKKGVRRPEPPRGTILVATQVIEQSLDMDFDLIVSDLAPMALLLQRAGRVWRHQGTAPYRPAWSRGPRLAVLVPVDDKGGLNVPKSWGDVYAPALLRRTLESLEDRAGKPVEVPADVQELVDGVYDEAFASKTPELLLKEDIDRLSDTMAREGLAHLVAIPKPGDVISLQQLTSSDADEDIIATRLGADTVQTLPVFEDAEHRRWLDEDHSVPLPEAGDAPGGRFSRALVRELLGYVVPLGHGEWRQDCTAANQPPAGWQDEARLAGIVLLPHTTGPKGPAGPALGKRRLTLHHELGLVTERLS
ncbi:CRISPR-associated endonuclease Cas3'' [Actinacidiphila acididurans]|uniref:CRISPR-associated endonuclease Cas3 n=1 Tax=Actinacidiphila acididurans TaxID=2784346 RepID=A0ABS2TXB8_9ACTN|nr:CRISPR-associated endonuclease Cas3'' [Actinacidiphila acididurans]MBM9507990.1 CRISPR-associated endonuclease Cas3'' [Actinacidiphila acididurans]